MKVGATRTKHRLAPIRAIALITLGSGLMNIFSVMGGPSHPAILTRIFPLEFIHLSRTLTMIIGFALVIASVNVYSRKHRAWAAVLTLSLASLVFHLTKGLDYREAAFSLVIAVLLIATRKAFTVRSSAPDLRSGIVRLGMAGALVLVYAIAGFWLLDQQHFSVNFHIGESVRAALQVITLRSSELVPRTAYGRWFLVSVQLLMGFAVVYAGFA